jgi:Fe-S-cluster containining protein
MADRKKKGKSKSKSYVRPSRLSFPEDIKSHDCLSPLIEAYYIVDKGISEAIQREERKKRTLACQKGCSSCCRTHETIPVYPLELVGISWYVAEKVSGPGRGILKHQLRSHRKNDACPFLLDGACIIHPMRPIACRQFIVFGRPCAESEDPYYTRQQDVLPSVKAYVDQAFFIMLPFYGVNDEAERWKMIENNSVHVLVKLIQTCNWNSLANKMDDFERNQLGTLSSPQDR